MRIHYQHDCGFPKRHVPEEAREIWFRWRCDTCGQVWKVRQFWSSGAARERAGFWGVNIKAIRYQARMRKEAEHG